MALIGTTTDEKIWNYLFAKIANPYGVSGLMGNLFAEAGLNPKNLQNTFETKLGYTDDTYTEAVDNGTYTNFIYDSAGYGLAQWTFWSRKQNLFNFAKQAGTSIGDLEMQLNFIFKELSEGYTSVLSVLKSATSVLEASNIVLTKFEAPADQSETVQQKRTAYAQTYFDKFAKNNVSEPIVFPATPFSVKVIIDDLNYRSEPSMNGIVKGQTGVGTFTIVKVSNGWGYLLSDAGWIYLGNPDYCTIGDTIKLECEPYMIRVPVDNLRIYKGPGTNYEMTGRCTEIGSFTIVEEAVGIGANKWGLLKSYQKTRDGWISLDSVTKI